MKQTLALSVLLTFPVMSSAKSPDCAGWPTNMALAHLKNAGLADNSRTDPSKATAVRLASEQIGEDLYYQIHRITFPEDSGATIEVITSNKASSEECSVSEVDVYVISRHLGGSQK